MYIGYDIQLSLEFLTNYSTYKTCPRDAILGVDTFTVLLAFLAVPCFSYLSRKQRDINLHLHVFIKSVRYFC